MASFRCAASGEARKSTVRQITDTVLNDMAVAPFEFVQRKTATPPKFHEEKREVCFSAKPFSGATRALPGVAGG
jgi:hypothetical protein